MVSSAVLQQGISRGGGGAGICLAPTHLGATQLSHTLRFKVASSTAVSIDSSHELVPQNSGEGVCVCGSSAVREARLGGGPFILVKCITVESVTDYSISIFHVN